METTSKPKFTVPVCAIVAMDEARTIGKAGGLPWHLPEDLKYFSECTRGHTVLMGRKTFDSLPTKYKPLPNRLNLVLSKQVTSLEFPEAKVFNNLDSVEEFCQKPGNLKGEVLWIVGGEQLYRLSMPWWDKVFVTKVKGDHKGDAFFPQFEKEFSLVSSRPATECNFEVYQRIV